MFVLLRLLSTAVWCLSNNSARCIKAALCLPGCWAPAGPTGECMPTPSTSRQRITRALLLKHYSTIKTASRQSIGSSLREDGQGSGERGGSYLLHISGHMRQQKCGKDHQQCVIIQQSIFPQLLGERQRQGGGGGDKMMSESIRRRTESHSLFSMRILK